MMTEHWLSIAAGVFLVGAMLYGHYRGLLRQCVSLGALILTIITVKIATPYVADFIKANPAVRENAADFICRKYVWDRAAEKTVGLYGGKRKNDLRNNGACFAVYGIYFNLQSKANKGYISFF